MFNSPSLKSNRPLLFFFLLVITSFFSATAQNKLSSFCPSGTGTSKKLAYQDFSSGTTTKYVTVVDIKTILDWGNTTSSPYTPVNFNVAKPDSAEFTLANSGAPSGAGGTYAAWWGGNKAGGGTWPQLYDHTTGTATSPYNYMAIFNLGKRTTIPFYSKTFSNLCSGTKLFFSAWAVSMVASGSAAYANPILTFKAVDPANGNVLASVSTNNVIPNSDITNGSAVWQNFGSAFTLPANGNSVRIEIYNNVVQTDGNDVAIDDIEIWMCKPSSIVASANLSGYCSGQPINLTATISDDNGTYASGYDYQWYYSSTGSAPWTTLSGIISGGSNKTNNYSFTATSASGGYYKVAVANAGSLNGTLPGTGSCEGIISNPVQVIVHTPAECGLPVKFSNFLAVNNQNDVLLSWRTEQDMSNRSFTVQYSLNGRDFWSMATMPYIQGTIDYTYKFRPPTAGTYCFRIMGTDVSGITTYTDIKRVAVAGNSGRLTLQVSPNPATDVLNVQLFINAAASAEFRVFDVKGIEVLKFTKHFGNGNDIERVPLPIQSLSSGVYILQVKIGGEIKTIKFVKAKL